MGGGSRVCDRMGLCAGSAANASHRHRNGGDWPTSRATGRERTRDDGRARLRRGGDEDDQRRAERIAGDRSRRNDHPREGRGAGRSLKHAAPADAGEHVGLKAELEAKTHRIAEFQQKNAQFDHKVAGLEQTIASLQAILKAKSGEIASLQRAVEQSQRKVTQLTEERTEDKQRIEQASTQLQDIERQLKAARQELNVGFYLIAKAESLVRQGVLTKSGGIIRKKTFAFTGSLAHVKFDTLDVADKTSIPVDSTAGNRYLFPPRETNTYHWSHDGPKPMLVIDDAKAFWQCRYLIIALD